MPSLKEVATGLGAIAPLEFAADWDNVGLLLEPVPRPPSAASSAEARVERVLLTIELGEAVLDEAIEVGAQLVVAYHPLIFKGLKRITTSSAEGRILLRAIDHRLAVYSPHTALDAVVGGVNDWLADALGPGRRRPVEAIPDAPEGTGMGRWIDLADSRGLPDLVSDIKAHLALERVRVATSTPHRAGLPIRTAAVCAGAGGSLLANLRDVDLLLTGEMRHHDVRELAERGTSVVLCDHTNTERGYLPRYAARIRAKWPDLEVSVSQRDRDPLQIS
jgi:dinuclear metal center YbgI/SA1388 family protein